MERYADGGTNHVRFLESTNLHKRSTIRQVINCGFIRHVEKRGVFTLQKACLHILGIRNVLLRGSIESWSSHFKHKELKLRKTCTGLPATFNSLKTFRV